MDTVTAREYCRLRALGWMAQGALRSARIRADWRAHDCGEHDIPDDDSYSVRLQVKPDEYSSYDDLLGDVYCSKANPDIPPARLERERKAEIERIERGGVWYVCGEYWNGTEWVYVAGCGGFIGNDWKDSGYDDDIKAATLAAWREHCDSQLLQGAV